MKVVLRFFVLIGVVALAGCQSPEGGSLDIAARRSQAAGIRLEFTRAARIYETGDALFAMKNGTSQVLWFLGQGPDSPAYRLKSGAATTPVQNAPAVGDGATVPERFPLSPGETRYFEIKIGDATGPLSVGITFYPSRTGTNGTTIWSSPAKLPPKPRRLDDPG